MSTKSYYLVGIKGVAMTALAQVLIDAGHMVFGSDVADSFVTTPILERLGIVADDFSAELPNGLDQVVYTAAHQASKHPQVQVALAKGIPTISHAQALANWFNQKQGVAVCGVGGKSTISAMISWIFEKAQAHPSYAVGVGEIIGLSRSGRWDASGNVFVAEADEYATDPVAVQHGAELLPRFAFLKPKITIASTITFDHPDVYRSEAHTRQVFSDWFHQLPSDGLLISSDENRQWLEQTKLKTRVLWYGQSMTSDLILTKTPEFSNQKSRAEFSFRSTKYFLELGVPGTYNMLNALAAIGATFQLGIPIQDSINYLAAFQSTKRRFEHIGTVDGVDCYDDYAHHPRELKVVLEAAKLWFDNRRVVIAFQPHTYSRTKALFDDFVTVLTSVRELVLLDIFGSARESSDPSVSSNQLVAAIREKQPTNMVKNVHSVSELAHYVKTELHSGDVFLTLGAGDIYTVYQHLGVRHV